MNKVIIIGSGPSGITSGIYLARAGIASSIITNKQSSLQKADLIENYYGFPVLGSKHTPNARVWKLSGNASWGAD